MTAKTLNRKAQRQIASLLDQAARALAAGQPTDPNLIETLQQSSHELDPRQAEADIVTPDTVSLKYAHQRLSAESFLTGARVALVALRYQGQPIGVIYDDLQRLALRTGEIITGLSPPPRLEQHSAAKAWLLRRLLTIRYALSGASESMRGLRARGSGATGRVAVGVTEVGAKRRVEGVDGEGAYLFAPSAETAGGRSLSGDRPPVNY